MSQQPDPNLICECGHAARDHSSPRLDPVLPRGCLVAGCYCQSFRWRHYEENPAATQKLLAVYEQGTCDLLDTILSLRRH